MPPRIKEYTLKDKDFTLSTIDALKLTPLEGYIRIIDEYLFEDLKIPQLGGNGELVVSLLYDMKGRIEDIREILENLDGELDEIRAGKLILTQAGDAAREPAVAAA
ncbi:MAG: hypothetical protein CVU61_09490 [Deltaproteobacteria bacterium HGW-Deltaproteobacteria-19]|jgi:hypothetical protein|nr:MAG: hypothetical protein CVU61_09490 [Deltaproteobacteria bacterium HGW-Deltaproteobacteria-19]